MSQSKPRLFVNRYSKAYIAELNSSRGYVLKDGENIIVFVDNRYYEKMIRIANNALNVEVVLTEDDLNGVIAYLKANNHEHLRIDFRTISHEQGRLLETNQIELENHSEDRLRLVKNEIELETIKQLATMTEQVFTEIQSKLQLGQSEKQVANIVNERIIKNGFDCASFPTIVAFGINSATPHHSPTDKQLEKDMNILIDFGGKLGNYNTDITRNLFIGTPSEEYKHLYSQVYNCQQSVIKGHYKHINQLQQKAYATFEKNKQNKNYLHNLGHGIGFEVHEYPDLNLTDKSDLVNNMIVTIEPGLYINEKYGIRIEDMVVVYDGQLYPITKSPKEIVCLSLT